jgi:NADP-dependent 3-hydroxy acid dehydrogenase YdfG
MALHYARAGDTVIISGRREDALHAVCREAETLPGDIVSMVFDVSDDSAISVCSETLTALAGHLDLVILNAGTCEYVSGGILEPDMFRRVMDTNYHGLLNSFIAALPLLRKAPDRPLVAGICSLAAFVGFPRAEAYGASKAASRYLLHSLRTDFNKELDITVVNPGFITTPLTQNNDFPMPFLMDADTAARRIAGALERRPLEYNFPKRLVFTLRLAQFFSRSWLRLITRKR